MKKLMIGEAKHQIAVVGHCFQKIVPRSSQTALCLSIWMYKTHLLKHGILIFALVLVVLIQVR